MTSPAYEKEKESETKLFLTLILKYHETLYIKNKIVIKLRGEKVTENTFKSLSATTIGTPSLKSYETPQKIPFFFANAS